MHGMVTILTYIGLTGLTLDALDMDGQMTVKRDILLVTVAINYKNYIINKQIN